MGALAAGLACAWSNRTGDVLLDPELVPDHEFDNLSGLLEVLPHNVASNGERE